MDDDHQETGPERRHKRVERVAEDALFKLIARGSMVSLVPLIGVLVLAIWDSQQKSIAAMTSATDSNTRAIIELKVAFQNLIGTDLPYRTKELGSRIDGLKDRLDTQDKINEAQHDALQEHDREIRNLQWRMSAARASPEDKLKSDQKKILQRGAR